YMTTKEIEALLARYYEGETSLREEHLLKEFFQSDDIPAHLQENKPIFGFFSVEAKSTVSPEFETSLQEKPGSGLVVSMNPPGRRLMLSLSLAASIILIAGLITVFKLGIFTPSQPYGTISDPQLAYTEARNALLLVSSRFNTGLNQMQHLGAFNTGVNQARQLQNFRTGIDEMNKFSQLEHFQPIILNPGRNPK
ncbi:MAG: hypothetical protein HQ542_13445, partial [Bacteroidia bacterium]|nr:hypothetical protein [Bacteroidia bacterium]